MFFARPHPTRSLWERVAGRARTPPTPPPLPLGEGGVRVRNGRACATAGVVRPGIGRGRGATRGRGTFRWNVPRPVLSGRASSAEERPGRRGLSLTKCDVLRPVLPAGVPTGPMPSGRLASRLAEGEGFEPPVRIIADSGFRNRPVRPLRHPSAYRKLKQHQHLRVLRQQGLQPASGRSPNPVRKPFAHD